MTRLTVYRRDGTVAATVEESPQGIWVSKGPLQEDILRWFTHGFTFLDGETPRTVRSADSDFIDQVEARLRKYGYVLDAEELPDD